MVSQKPFFSAVINVYGSLDQTPSMRIGPYVADLPTDLSVEILSRLPIKAVAVCRLVCKEWLSLLSDHRFLNLHRARSPAGVLLIPIDNYPITNPLRLLDIDTLRTHCPRETQMKLNSKIDFPLSGKSYRFMNSVNGLLCFIDYYNTHICNPISGESFVLPREPQIHFLEYKLSALGFSARTNQYKVIEFVNLGKQNEALARVYTFGERSWRNIGHVPCSMDFPRTIDALLDGVIHWLAPTETSSCLICWFNFNNDQLGFLPGPSELVAQCNGKLMDGIRLCVLRDSLTIFDTVSFPRVALWVMNDYGVTASWRKLYVFDSMDRSLGACQHPVMILKNGEVLLLVNETRLALYNPKLNVLMDVYVHGTCSKFLSIAFVPSFVSLQDVARGENIKKKAKKGIVGRKRKSRQTLL